MKWNESIKEFINYLKIERGLAENTTKSYQTDLKLLHQWLKKNYPKSKPLKINTATLQEFLYQRSKKVKTATQNRTSARLRTYLAYLHFSKYRDSNPMAIIESPKAERSLPDVLSLEEIDAIIAEIDLSHPQGERNRAIIELLYSCGLRVSELINLRISDLFFEEAFIRVEGKGSKQRLIPIAPITQRYINTYINQIRVLQEVKPRASDIIFLNRRGNKLTRNMIFIIIKDLVEKAGIEKNVSPHTFRHSFATHLLQNGADLSAIQQMLGHESITTTEIYTHIDNTQIRETLYKFHPRNK